MPGYGEAIHKHYQPTQADYLEDLVCMVDHFFSYQYRPGRSDTKYETYGSIYEVPIYKDNLPRRFDDCTNWFDFIAYKKYDKQASVQFVIDKQEEILSFTNIK